MPDPAISKAFERIEGLPRERLLALPTPLEPAPTLSAELGVRLLFKRDDLGGIGGGGNKLRKLEFILGQALRDGVSALITTGGRQSNHARLTAAVAARAGLASYLALRGEAPAALRGNLLLERLFGAETEFLGECTRQEADRHMEALAVRLRAGGEVPMIVPLGGATPEGTIGYFLAFHELLAQCRASNLTPDVVALAAGTGSTFAGLVLGAGVLAPATRVAGISVSWTREELLEVVPRHANDAAAVLELDTRVEPDDLWITDDHIGPGYSIPSPEGQAALRRTAAREGVLLDSTYTAKAMAGLIALIEAGTIPHGSTVVFMHTGGTPELFARELEDFGLE
ncbi:MAG: pyridoxal-phosphate dependent enzyme [Gammaproteobacteria bacterium]|nr:pyridoxal-phosphate dependent enzyme [Gammaproteobacteria bacterium]NIR85031.1 pyridoxal-phosphate dependent enzyme [Gammaproteobacteria bacterium]NIR88298.1 pyridoxal-phosphate dependent enzyme [Gammaproteobacteria bacterium]NIU06078.1 pyridoxal-phosphate dependent enzyme [Gammaproteobacteria bacterium]NIV73497.1 pyridoxal-phosphate dependent enzyme [Gammaproteobacteria bacterium]